MCRGKVTGVLSIGGQAAELQMKDNTDPDIVHLSLMQCSSQLEASAVLEFIPESMLKSNHVLCLPCRSHILSFSDPSMTVGES